MQPDVASDSYARSAAEMTAPRTAREAIKKFLLYKVHDRVLPLYYRKFHGGIKCITFHYLFEHEMEHAYRVFRAAKTEGDFITTKELLECLARGRRLSSRLYHLSIDDGFENIVTNAHPLLQLLNIPYGFFVCPAYIGKGAVGEIEFMKSAEYARPLRLADWSMLQNLSTDGVEIGSHSFSHARLIRTKSRKVLHSEIAGAKREIEHALKRECSSFAWPFGRRSDISDRALNLAIGAGYKAIFGVGRATICPSEPGMGYFLRHHFEPWWPLRAVRYYLTRVD
jgi:peptidoglycan/xylan/chitin deacetylase (PgdA/CDA1 family)